MGTTVTTNLSLIKPDTDESIREDLPTFDGWAAQNAVNMDKVDALFRRSLGSYTPVFQGSGSNPTLGAGGSVTGRYIRTQPAMVIGEIRINVGAAGFAAGTGTYISSLPFAVAPNLMTFDNSFPIGKAFLLDNSAVAGSTCLTVMVSTALNHVFFRSSLGGVWSPTTPFTLAQNDKMVCYFAYPTSAA